MYMHMPICMNSYMYSILLSKIAREYRNQLVFKTCILQKRKLPVPFPIKLNLSFLFAFIKNIKWFIPHNTVILK